METEKKITLTFRPQAWINDWAVAVDPEGPTTWEVPLSRLKGIRMDTQESDDLRFDPQVPQWCKDWRGPFEVEWDKFETEEA